jgi:hypothetical protein
MLPGCEAAAREQRFTVERRMKRWTCSSLLRSNAEELEELALFYRSQGYFLASTLIGAAALSIRQNVGEIEAGQGEATCSTK